MMFREFFRGRYGMDTLGFALIVGSVILFSFPYIWMLGVVPLAAAVFRSLSKNTGKRYQEQLKFENLVRKIGQKVSQWMAGLRGARPQGSRSTYQPKGQQDRNHLLVKCPKCSNTLRLPRNKGKLAVTCPVCRHEFTKKT